MKIIRYHNSPRYIAAFNRPSLREEIDRLFEVAYPAVNAVRFNAFVDERQGDFPIDLYQEKEVYFVRAELPGFRKEDIGVEVSDGVLTLTAHHKTETGSGKEAATATTQEGKVSRSFNLPENLKLDSIQAAYENGVLTVTLPKNEEVKPKSVAVEVK